MLIVKDFNIPKILPKIKLPQNIVKHCNFYKDNKNKHDSLFAWMCLSKYINLLDVKFTKNGKPYLVDNKKYFSLSHSFNKVAIAINDKPIGIDVEAVIPLNIVSALAQRLLDGVKLKEYYEARDRAIWFTKYWTMYEAFNKLKGDKLSFKTFKQKINTKIITKKTLCNFGRNYIISCATL